MIEVYLFFAVFPVQILAMSVLYPYRLSRLIRQDLANTSAERLAELYPGVDVGRAHERFLARYRAANAVVVVLGLLLLGGFVGYMRGPDWDEGTVGGLVVMYFLLQHLPIVLISWHTTRFRKLHRTSSPASKRRAMLQRRGLFDFVSPLAVILAALSYALFVAFMFYIARDPFPGFAGPLINVGIVTLMVVLGGFFVYRVLHGRKTDPIQTHANRMYMMSAIVNTYVWMCILLPVLLSLSMARKLLDLPTWGPFAVCVAFLLLAMLSFRGLSAPPREPESDGSGASPVHQ